MTIGIICPACGDPMPITRPGLVSCTRRSVSFHVGARGELAPFEGEVSKRPRWNHDDPQPDDAWRTRRPKWMGVPSDGSSGGAS